MHKSSEFRGTEFMVRVKGECPIYIIHTKLFVFFQEATQASESSAINTFSSQSPGPQDQEILNWFQFYIV